MTGHIILLKEMIAIWEYCCYEESATILKGYSGVRIIHVLTHRDTE